MPKNNRKGAGGSRVEKQKVSSDADFFDDIPETPGVELTSSSPAAGIRSVDGAKPSLGLNALLVSAPILVLREIYGLYLTTVCCIDEL
jgi:hypothetical protein